MPRHSQLRPFLVAVLLLLCQAAGLAELHAAFLLETAVPPRAGEVVHPEACHPWEAAHVEATGVGRPARLGTLSQHLLRAIGVRQASTPQPDFPVAVFSLQLSPVSFRSAEPAGSAGPRAPPSA